MNTPFRPLRHDGVLHPFVEGVHLATGTASFLGIPIWNTAALLELEAPGELLVWNPIALEPPLLSSVRELEARTGRRVTVLLCGLDYHHRAIAAWQAAWPDARTLLVSARIPQQQPAVRGEVLDPLHPALPDHPDLRLVAVRGFRQPAIERSPAWRDGPRHEWWVLHRPSRTLLMGDLVFVNAEPTWVERTLLGWRVGFTRNGPGFRTLDRDQRRAFVDEVLALGAEQAVSVHGRSTVHGAETIRSELRAIFPG